MKAHTAHIGSKTAYVSIAIASFLIFLTGLVFPLSPTGPALTSWQVSEDGGWQPVSIPLFRTIQSIPSRLDLRTDFPAGGYDALVIPRQSGNAIQVWQNGRLIYSAGELSQPTANLWNYVHLVRLDQPLLPENTLEVRLSSSYYASGINALPYLANYAAAAPRVTYLNWIYNDFLIAANGAAAILAVILLILTAARRSIRRGEFLMALALLLGILYTQDALFRPTSGSLDQFLWIKKLIMASGYLGSLSFLCGVEQVYWNRLKVSRWLAGLTIISVLAVLAAPNLLALAATINLTNAALLFNLLVVVGMIVRRPGESGWLLVPAVWLLLSAVQMLLAAPLGLTWPLMTPYTFLIAIILIGARLVVGYNQLINENTDLRRMKYVDPLTGALNRRFLDENPPARHAVLVMIDLDGFKSFNDTLGHGFGDQLLVQFTDAARANLRQHDLLLRMGGDEFLLLLDQIPGTPAGRQQVKLILERIQEQFAACYPDIVVGFSYGIATHEGSLTKTQDLADQRMYAMKESKRRDLEMSA